MRVHKRVRISTLCFCLMMIGLLVLPTKMTVLADTDDPNIVKIGYYQVRDFQEGDGEQTMRSGYGYEYIQKVASYTGWQYEYVAGDWNELYEMLQNGEIDLMAGISYSEERSETISFPDYEMLKETFYIYKDIGDSSMKSGSIDSFSGKVIGVMNDERMISCLENWQEENQANITIRHYEDLEACARDFNEHKIDAFVSADNVISSSSYTGVTPVELIGKEPYYLCVAKNRSDILDGLNMALTIMNAQDSLYLDNLRNKYAADTSISVFVSKQEQEWMESHERVTVGYLDYYMPYSDTDKKGKVNGLIRDLVPDLFAALPGDYAPEIVYQGYEDQEAMIQALKNGEVDFIFPVGDETPFAEKSGYQQSSIVMNVSTELVYTGTYDNSTTDRIAVNKNNQLQYYFTISNYPDAEIVFCNSSEACVQLVKEGKADSSILNALRVEKLTGNEPDVNVLPLSEMCNICFGVKFGDSALLRLLNHGLSILGEGYGLNRAYQYIGDMVAYTVGDFVHDYQAVIYVSIAIVLGCVIWFAISRYRSISIASKKEAEHNQRLKEALKREQQANYAKQVFLNNMSHDIRTPLNGILGILEINGKCQDPELLEQNRQKAKTSIYQLLDLVSNVIEMSKLESGEVEAKKEVIDLTELIGEVRENMEQHAAQAGVALICQRDDVQEIWPPVYGNTAQIREILVHILKNAVKYNKAGGQIYWEDELKQTSDAEAMYRCSIKDTGIGMNPEFLERIFEPFAQEKNDARTVYRGAGLGMAIVKTLIDQMHGTIQIESTPNKGTTVRIELPFTIVPPDEIETITNDSVERDEAARSEERIKLSGQQILLVEDNELNIEIEQFMLEEAGANITVARDGEQAIKAYLAAPAGTYDDILMDIMMPVMDGYETARAIRASGRADAKTIPIAATTACVSEEARKNCEEAGMDAFFGKPLDMGQVVEWIAGNVGEKE